MFVVYENATKEDKPLERVFMFPSGTKVQYKNEAFVSEGKYITFKVHSKGKVRATNHPSEIICK